MEGMTSPIEKITIICPACFHSFESWHRASMNLQIEEFSEEYIRKATIKTCPACGQEIHLGTLIVQKDGTWQVSGEGE
jgi:hypothetical protein